MPAVRLSLFEVLGGAVLLALVVTVVSHAFGASVESRQRDSLARLKTLHRAAAIYRFEADGNWPPRESVSSNYLGFGKDYFISPCANKPGYMRRTQGISYMYLWTPSRAGSYVAADSDAPLFVDLDCNRTHSPEQNVEKVGLAVAANGETIVLKKEGDPRRWSWWLSE